MFLLKLFLAGETQTLKFSYFDLKNINDKELGNCAEDDEEVLKTDKSFLQSDKLAINYHKTVH
jgi:hypothetical protein